MMAVPVLTYVTVLTVTRLCLYIDQSFYRDSISLFGALRSLVGCDNGITVSCADMGASLADTGL